MSARDLYKILGVARSSSAAEIKFAFRKLAQRLHPDKETGDAEAYAEVQHAYDTLKDPEARERYDRTGEAGERIDSTEQMAFKMIIQVVDALMRHHDFALRDYLPDARRALYQSREQAEAFIRDAEQKVERLENLLTAYEGDGLLSPIQHEIDRNRTDLENARKNVEVTSKAIEIVKAYRFKGLAQLEADAPGGVREYTFGGTCLEDFYNE